MNNLIKNDDFMVAHTFSNLNISMTELATLMDISRVTLNISKNQFDETGKCNNKKCMLLFYRLRGLSMISRELVFKEIDLVNRYFENLDLLDECVLNRNLEVFTNWLEILNNMNDENSRLDPEFNLRIDNVLIRVSKKYGRYYNGQTIFLPSLNGNAIVLKKDDLEKEILKFEEIKNLFNNN